MQASVLGVIENSLTQIGVFLCYDFLPLGSLAVKSSPNVSKVLYKITEYLPEWKGRLYYITLLGPMKEASSLQ